MTPCEECAAARETNGLWRRFDSRACIYCAARHLQIIGRLGIPREEATARRKAALADSIAHGFDEATLREMVKGPMAVEPLPQKER